MKKYLYQTIEVKNNNVTAFDELLHLKKELKSLGDRGYRIVGKCKSRDSDILIMEMEKEEVNNESKN